METDGKADKIANLHGSSNTSTTQYSHRYFRDTSPNVSIHHFDRPSYSGYKERVKSFQVQGKRKSTAESTFEFHPVTKQQITEARIASSMQKLSLNNEVAALIPASNRTSDEGFYEDINGFDFDDSDDDDLDLTDGDNKPNLPQFTLAPGIKDDLKNVGNDILPQKIFQSMNQACLAVVPYHPPSDFMLNFNDEKEEIVTNEKNVSNLSNIAEGLIPKVATESEDEMFAEWEHHPEENAMIE